MPKDKALVSKEFRSLADFQANYFPDMEAEVERVAGGPRQIGARLARQVLTEVMPTRKVKNSRKRAK
jgi:hypothetical protein